MKKRCILISLIFSCIHSLNADSITLNNGNRIRGEVIGESTNTLRINVGCGLTQIISKKNIATRKIEKPEVILLYLGKKELERKQLSRAIKTLKRARLAAPANKQINETLVQAWIEQSKIESKRKYPQAALQVLLDAKEVMPDNKELDNYITEAKSAIALLDTLETEARKQHIQGNHEKSIILFDQLIEKDFSRNSKIKVPFSESLVALGDKEIVIKKWNNAADYYDRALVIHPDLLASIEDRWITSHMQPVTEEINNRNYTYALQEIRKVLMSTPNNDNALYLLGVTLRNMSENEKARQVFEKILRNHNNESESGTENIKKPDINELTEQAKKHFKNSFRLISLNEAKAQINKALPGGWKEVKGPNWTLFHHSPYFADQIKLVINDMMSRITEEFSGNKKPPALDPPLEIYLYRNFKEYKNETKSMGWSAGVTRTAEINGEIVKRRILSYQAPQFMQSTLPHELGHVILPLLLKRNPSKIPHWLNEGMAVSLEPKYKKDNYRNLIRQEKASGKRLRLKTILESEHYPGDEETVKYYYAKSYVFVDYLIKDMGQKEFLLWAKKVGKLNSLEMVEQLYADIEKLEDIVFGN